MAAAQIADAKDLGFLYPESDPQDNQPMTRLLLGMTLGATLLLSPTPAACTYCGNLYCINSSACFSGCACMMDFGEPSGICVAVE